MKINKKKSTRICNKLSNLRYLPNCKHSQSQVIATILLILIVISAITIILGFVLPFVKETLERGDCFKVANEIEILNNPSYTCYESISEGDNKMRVQIHMGDDEDRIIDGFLIKLKSDSSKSYKITTEEVSEEISVYGDETADVLIPDKNEERTYVITDSEISEKPSSISIYTMLKNGEICDVSDPLVFIEDCQS